MDDADRGSARVLVVRLDAFGDVLLAGPAVRAVAASGARVSLLCGPEGRAAAELLPHVDDLITWTAPWIAAEPPPVDAAEVGDIVRRVRERAPDEAVILTSFHQSALPTALILRLAGVPRITAISEDYPGALLDVRHRVDEDIPEAERALSVAAAAGFALPAGDDGRLAVTSDLPDVTELAGEPGYVVAHPGTSVSARAWPPYRFAAAVRELAADGYRVVVTGGRSEHDLTRTVAGEHARDLGGRTDARHLAAVLRGAAAVVAGNTGPAHLAAAVGTPVVSLFAPTVPAVKWAPYGVPVVLLGDQHAPCRDTRARACPVPGHPCLTSVTPDDVVRAIRRLTVPRTSRSSSAARPGREPEEPSRTASGPA